MKSSEVAMSKNWENRMQNGSGGGKSDEETMQQLGEREPVLYSSQTAAAADRRLKMPTVKAESSCGGLQAAGGKCSLSASSCI